MSLTPYKLKVSEVSVIRERLAEEQGGRCAICQLPLSKPCLDHDHLNGNVRGVLHNGCNAVLGKVENSYKRYGVINLAAFLNGVAGYLQKHRVNQTGYLHPTFRTEDQKRERRNTKARAARAARKPSE